MNSITISSATIALSAGPHYGAETWDVPFELVQGIHWTREILSGPYRKAFMTPQLVGTAEIFIDNPANARVRREGPYVAKRTLVIQKDFNDEIWDELIAQFPKPAELRSSLPLTAKRLRKGIGKLMEFIRSREEHPAIHKHKDGRCYINARELGFIHFDDPTYYTIAKRVRRFYDEMRATLLDEGSFEVNTYRSYIAFRYNS